MTSLVHEYPKEEQTSETELHKTSFLPTIDETTPNKHAELPAEYSSAQQKWNIVLECNNLKPGERYCLIRYLFILILLFQSKVRMQKIIIGNQSRAI